jgi:hypothetical protein
VHHAGFLKACMIYDLIEPFAGHFVREQVSFLMFPNLTTQWDLMKSSLWGKPHLMNYSKVLNLLTSPNKKSFSPQRTVWFAGEEPTQTNTLKRTLRFDGESAAVNVPTEAVQEEGLFVPMVDALVVDVPDAGPSHPADEQAPISDPAPAAASAPIFARSPSPPSPSRFLGIPPTLDLSASIGAPAVSQSPAKKAVHTSFTVITAKITAGCPLLRARLGHLDR